MKTHNLVALDPHGFHRLVYREWGSPRAPRVVVCAHGLTRNGRDFDLLADALSSRHRVVCPDVVGRGDSDWLEHKEDYGFALYQSDAAALIARVTAPHPPSLTERWRRTAGADAEVKIDWIGTSMGGLIGMMLAAQPRSPLGRLVLNDVGPLVPWGALLRLKGHVRQSSTFESLDEAETYVREVCATFGPLTDTQWRHLAMHSVRRGADGTLSLAYDPAISSPTAARGEFQGLGGRDIMRGLDLWSVWDEVRCPTLVVRGADSDLLLADTAEEMKHRGPGAHVVEFPGIGHAPALMSADQIGAISDFLSAAD